MNDIYIGIDIGGSTTKIVGFKEDRIISPLQLKATDPLASVYGAFGKFLAENKLSISDVKKIMVSGVGSTHIIKPLFDIPTGIAAEFDSLALGGLYLSQLDKAIVVSMGTGTALVMADWEKAEHIGGTGVGGGTLLGLCSEILGVRTFDNIIEVAKEGNLKNIDLTIGDISRGKVSKLPEHTTASNFGKISDLASKGDKALGVINLVFETIGMISIFATRIYNIDKVVLAGHLTLIPQAEEVFGNMHNIFGVDFIIPEHARFATALGAALCCVKGKKYIEIN